MEDLKEKTANLANHIEEIAQTFYRLTIVNITQKLSRLSAGAVVTLMLCVLGFFAIFFLGFALAWWLGDVINSRAGGFVLAAVVFIVLLLVFVALRRKTIFPYFRDMIIRKMYDNED